MSNLRINAVRRPLVVVALGGAALIGAFTAYPTHIEAAGSATTAAAKRITVGDNFFRPRTVLVRKGGRVVWAWKGRRKHDVRFVSGPRAGRPRSCATRRRGDCSRRFRRAGTYGYVCVFHGSMAAQVRVR